MRRLFNDTYAIFVSNFLLKSIFCWYSFELPRLVEAIQISTNNICLYKEAEKKSMSCNLKTTKLLGCALIRVCVAITLKMVYVL